MKPVLVTGATGFVGWHVARKLLDRGERGAGAGARSGASASVAGIGGSGAGAGRSAGSRIRWRGRWTDCGVVYHVAADYRLWAPRSGRDVPFERGRHAQSAGRRASRRAWNGCVYTSTVGCIGIPKGESAIEDTPGERRRKWPGPYKRSKFLAEQVALEFAGEGFPVVIVNPTAPVGDHDFKPTPTGKIVVDFVRGAMPAFLDTGLERGRCAATWPQGTCWRCERGRAGERYILGSENLTLRADFCDAGGDRRESRRRRCGFRTRWPTRRAWLRRPGPA